MDGNRRDSGCRPFFCARCNQQLVRWKAGSHGRMRRKYNLSGGRRVLTDESHRNTTCPVGGGFSRTSDIKIHLSGERRVFTDEVAFPPRLPQTVRKVLARLKYSVPLCKARSGFSILTEEYLTFQTVSTLHTRDDLHDEKKQGRAAVGK